MAAVPAPMRPQDTAGPMADQSLASYSRFHRAHNDTQTKSRMQQRPSACCGKRRAVFRGSALCTACEASATWCRALYVFRVECSANRPSPQHSPCSQAVRGSNTVTACRQHRHGMPGGSESSTSLGGLMLPAASTARTPMRRRGTPLGRSSTVSVPWFGVR